MAHVRVTRTGFLGNLMNSVMGIPIGILLFLISFWVLFKNEGLPNMGKIAESQSSEVAADETGHDGDFVSVTGTLESSSMVGDPDFLSPGNYINLSREVEMYAWVEHSESETRDKVGGGTETITTYSYELEWTSSPRTTGMDDPSYNNPAMTISAGSWEGDSANVGAWNIDIGDARWPGGDRLSPSGLPLLGQAARGTIQGEYIYLGYGSPNSPSIGDHRISFRALQPGGEVTAFGEASGGNLVAHDVADRSFLRVLSGDREAAISTLKLEAAALKWGLRILGFLLMWFGMQMVFAPLHAVAGILPFLKRGTKSLIALITFPIAAILTLLTIVISAILHSVVALIVVFAISAGIMAWLWKNRGGKGGDTAAVAPGTPPPPGPPPGPSPAAEPPTAAPGADVPPDSPPA